MDGGMDLKEGVLLLLLLLSVCDDVADVLVVHIASHIWGEGSPQVLHLEGGETARESRQLSAVRATQ